MALPRFIDIDGRRYLWRDLVALRRAQGTPVGGGALAGRPVIFAQGEQGRLFRGAL